MQHRFLEPSVLAGMSDIQLVAKMVVNGFISGLHRSPDFGFSQEFAEYRPYSMGDDLRYVDWNVFARTEKTFLKRYRGETNTRVTVLLDASASMGFGSHRVPKIDYARYLAASMCYLALEQRDACGIIVFDDEVRQFVPPRSRQGQLARLLHAVEHAEPRAHTDFAKPFFHFQQYQFRRGIAIVISDFYAPPEVVVKTIEPLRFRGTEVVLFHVLDPEELKPKFRDPVILVDMETKDSMEVSPDYANNEYRTKIRAHVEELGSKARGAGLGYHVLDTSQPLDEAMREYFRVREGRY
ncbi:MAG: DUF58 domain-containing protein [Candidatus Solibacter usitatus]|nr:DUF58 domain-containing protein [Candidatus Solibacter usitatus]